MGGEITSLTSDPVGRNGMVMQAASAREMRCLRKGLAAELLRWTEGEVFGGVGQVVAMS